jgi:hypothetical protein
MGRERPSSCGVFLCNIAYVRYKVTLKSYYERKNSSAYIIGEVSAFL